MNDSESALVNPIESHIYYTHIDTYIYIRIYIHIYIYRHTYIYTHIYTHIYMDIHIYTCTYIYTLILRVRLARVKPIEAHIYYTHIYVCVHLRIYPHHSACLDWAREANRITYILHIYIHIYPHSACLDWAREANRAAL
jgi:hypothetical protein